MNISGIHTAKIYQGGHSVKSKQVKENKVSEVGNRILPLEKKVEVGAGKKIYIKMEKLKQEFSLSKRIFLSIFSRKYEVLTKLTPFFWKYCDGESR